MHRQIRPLTTQLKSIIQQSLKSHLPPKPHHHHHHFHTLHSLSTFLTSRSFHHEPTQQQHPTENISGFSQKPENKNTQMENSSLNIQTLLKSHSDEDIEQALNESELELSESLVLDVLKRHNSDWKMAFKFFNWVLKSESKTGYELKSLEFNEMIGILGRMKRFEEARQVFDEMAKREGVLNERAYGIMVHRLASGHLIDDAIGFFYKRKEYGLKLDLIAFQTLLMALCRYKHVEAAEFLFHSKRGEFTYDTKTWNVVLNGWCVLGNLRETKRFWNEIIRSKCKPDRVTYGIFINALCKNGKISTAVKLFHAMWEQGCAPDVVICNSVIDGLCFKKRIPEALEIFKEMNEKDCEPDAATYNCLIKHLCRIQRMEVVCELVNQMEEKGGDCSPNARTYGYLLSSSRNPDEVSMVLKRMEKTGCKMTGDTYNLLLRLYMKWNCEELVQSTWTDMVRDGIGPDQRSYTVMIHGLFDQERLEEALEYYNEMTSKGMIPEQRTVLLVDAMKIKLKERGPEDTGKAKLANPERKKDRKNKSSTR